MVIQPLSFISQEVCIQALLGHSQHASKTVVTYVLDLFNTDKYTAVSEGILKRIIALYPKKLTDNLLLALVPPHIKELELKDCTSVGIQGIINVCKKCKKLKTLDLTRCDQLAQSCVFRLLGRVAPSITALSLEECSKVTDHTVQTILRQMLNLRSLSLSCCSGITDDVFLLDADSQLGVDTDNETMPTFSPDLPYAHLTSLDLSGCQSITSKAIRHLTTLCGLSLRHVDISWTKIDILALWYLSGYNLSSAIDLTMNIKDLHGNHEEILQQIKQINMERSPSSGDDWSQKVETQGDRNWAGLDTECSDPVQNDVKSVADDCVKNVPHYPSAPDAAVVTNSKTCEFNCFRDVALETGENDFKSSIVADEIECLSAANFDNSESVISGDDFALNVDDVSDSSESSEYFEKESVSDIIIGCDNRSSTSDDCVTTSGKYFAQDGTFFEISEYSKDDCAPVVTVGCDDSKSLPNCFVSNANQNDIVRPVFLNNFTGPDVFTSAMPVTNRPTDSRTLQDNMAAMSLSEAANFHQSEPAFELVSNQRSDTEVKGAHRHADENLTNQVPALEVKGHGLSVEDKMEFPDNFEVVHFVDLEEERSQAFGGSKYVVQSQGFGVTVDTWDSNLGSPGFEPVIPQGKSESQALGCGSVSQAFGVSHVPEKLSDLKKNFLKRGSQEIIQFYKPNISVIKINFMERPWSYDLGAACLKAFFSKNDHVTQMNITWKGMNDELLEYIAERVPNVTFVKLTDCESLGILGLVKLAEHCPKIEHLDLKGVCFIGDAAVGPLVSNRCLSSLSLAECNVTDTTLRMLTTHCSDKLEWLDLSWCENLTIDGINLLARSAPNLRKLELRQCAVTDRTLEFLAENSLLLEELNLSNVDITDDGVICIAKMLPRLAQLDISWNQALTDDCIHAILTHCSNMVDLCLVGLKRLSSKPFLPIIADLDQWRRCQALLRLKHREQDILDPDEHYSSDEEFEDLFIPHRSTSYVPNLRRLNLDYCDRVNDTHLGEIVAVCRGSLSITDYYGCSVNPIWVLSKQA